MKRYKVIGDTKMDPQQQPTNSTQQTNSPQPPLAPSEPPKSKKTMLIVAIIIVAIVALGVIIFAMLGSNKTDTTKTSDSASTSEGTNKDSDKYQTYDVVDKQSGVTFSVSFYKDAKVEEKNGRTYLNSGEVGSMYSIYLGTATGDKIDCGQTPTTTMRLGGESTTVCYASDNMQYAGYAKAKNGAVKLNLAGQNPISLDDAKAIMESATFN